MPLIFQQHMALSRPKHAASASASALMPYNAYIFHVHRHCMESARPSMRPSVSASVLPSVRLCIRESVRPCFSSCTYSHARVVMYVYVYSCAFIYASMRAGVTATGISDSTLF